MEQVRTAQAIRPVAAVQAEISLWARDSLAELVPYAARENIVVLAYCPLGRGFLAGRFASSEHLPDGSARYTVRICPRCCNCSLSVVFRINSITNLSHSGERDHSGAWLLGLQWST